MAGVIKARFEGKLLTSRAEYDLFHALTTDPNDIVCDSTSVLSDMLNRVKLQIQLWNSVLHLRQGQYYGNSFSNFISTVDTCRLNKQDTPDLVYGKYDGIVIKRLLSAFSFRPSVVATTPIQLGMVNAMSINPYLMNVRPVVTNVPMINLRLPPVLDNNIPQINLQNAIQQEQYFLEGGTIVPRNTSLIWSRGILIFYVDRRSIMIRQDHMSAFSMNNLPHSVAGFEKINRRVVKAPLTGLKVREEEYELRSVIISELHKEKNSNNVLTTTSVVIGSSTLIRKPEGLRGKPMYYVYDPLAPSHARDKYSGRRYTISSIKETDNDPECSFENLSETQGTVYIYSATSEGEEAQQMLRGEMKTNLSNLY